MSQNESDQVGIILSESTTTEALCQLLESAERGGIREGMLLIVKTRHNPILARVAQIVPYNAFYTPGDPWSEARRKNIQIPQDVARKYEICRLELLIELPKNEIKYPPNPGDSVHRLDPTKHQKEIFGVSRGQSKYIWYGTLAGYDDASVPLYVENIPMHMAIFGVTGSGKSFDTGVLIEKLTEIPVKDGASVSFPMIVVDAHGDYIDYVDHVVKNGTLGKIGWITRYVFPNAFEARLDLRKRESRVQPIAINLDSISTRELAEIIMLFYKGTTEGSELAIDGISALLEQMKQNKGYNSIQDIFVYYHGDLRRELETLAKESNMHPSTKGSIQRALDSFRTIETEHKLLSYQSDLKDVEIDKSTNTIKEVKFVERMTREGGIAIFDFSADGAPGVDLKTKQLVMTYVASLLFEQFTKYKIKKDDRYLMFVIEEAQNFAPDRSYPVGSTLAHTKLAAIATQGRKFGLSLCLISQRPSFVDRIVLSMCNTYIIHRISPEDVGFVKAITGGLPGSLMNRLTNLERGEVIITGQMNTVPFPLLVRIPHHERKVRHTVGETKVVENLAKLRGFE